MRWTTDPTITNWPADNSYIIRNHVYLTVNVRNAMAVLPPTVLRHAITTLEPENAVADWPSYLWSWLNKHRIWQAARTPAEIRRRNDVLNDPRRPRWERLHCQPCRNQLQSPEHHCRHGQRCRRMHAGLEQWPMTRNFPFPADDKVFP